MKTFDLSKKHKVTEFEQYTSKCIEKKKKIKIEDLKPIRNNDQNGLYWLWLTALEKESEIGYLKEHFHYLFRAKYLPKDDERIEKIIIPELWSRLKTRISEFIHFKGIEEIIDIISYSTTEQDQKQFESQ